MSKRRSFNGTPGDFERLSDYSNSDLRLAPEYADVEEAYRKIQSFKDAVETLEGSETSYTDSAKAVASAWPEAYEAFHSLDEIMDEVPEKLNAEKVMNSGFKDFDEESGEVSTRYRELNRALEEAEEMYNRASASLVTEVQTAVLLDKRTPVDYAKDMETTEDFEERAEKILENTTGTSDGSGIMRLLIDEA